MPKIIFQSPSGSLQIRHKGSRRTHRFTILPAIGLLAACVALASPAPAQAQGTDNGLERLLSKVRIVDEGDRRVVVVTLKDLLALALTRSNGIKVARIGQEIARSRLVAAETRNNPTLTNKVEQSRSITPFSSTFSAGNFLRLGRSNETVISSEWSKKTSSGITYGLKLEDAQGSSDTLNIAAEGDSPVVDTTTTTSTVSATSLTGLMNIPLIKDAGSDVNDIPVRQGELGVQRSGFDVLQDEQDILRTVALVYWNLVDIIEQVKVQEEAVRLSERLLKDNRARLRAGVISPADVKVSQAQLARDRQILLQFQLQALRVEDQLRAALNLESLEMGYRPADHPEVRETRFDYKSLAEKMYARNPQLGILKTTLESNTYDLVAAQNEDATDLDLDLFYVLNGYSSSTFGGTSGFSETDLAAYGATLTWTLPLFDHKSEELIQQRNLERSQIELRLADLRSNLSVQLQSVLRSMRLAQKEVETAKVSVDLAKELLQNEIERFRLGRSTSFQVAEFQQDAALAGREEIAARVNYERAYLEMLILTAGIHEFYGLSSDSR